MAKIIRTPARNITVCGVRPDGSVFFPPPPPPPAISYALAFDGVNDYLQNSVGTPFVQWQRTQAFTFEFFLKSPVTVNGLFQSIFDSRFGANFRGVAVFITNTGRLEIQLLSTPSIVAIARTANSVAGATHIAITYAGDSNANNINIFINGILVTKLVAANSLTNTITGTTQVTVGFRNLAGSGNLYFVGDMKEVSFTNYAKTQPEINADIAAGTQLAGTGSFLFRLPLIYKDNGTGNIATLDSTVPIPELAQSLNMQYFGYPNPLVLGTNLIEI